MRTLTSVCSSTSVLMDLELYIEASDVSTTYKFTNAEIISYPKVSWEIDYYGGLAKSSNYNITLASSIGFIRDNLSKLSRAKTFLKVYANSDNFTPHVGRIAAIEREAHKPDIFNINVYDDFFDGDPLIPLESLANSYSTLHPEVSNVDMGYPLYYGQHLRPIPFIPVDSSFSVLIGPRNVSSANHNYQNTNTIWTSARFENSVFQFNGVWNQQSGSDNLVNPGSGFNYEIFSPTREWSRLWDFADVITREGFVEDRQGIPSKGNMQIITDRSLNTFKCDFNLEATNQYILRASTLNYQFKVFSLAYPTAGNVTLQATNNLGFSTIAVVSASSVSCGVWEVPSSLEYMSPDYSNGMKGFFTTSVTSNYSSRAFITCSLAFNFMMSPEAYKNYSIYFRPAAFALDVAFSRYPNNILADVLDQTSFQYVSDKMTTVQSETSVYQFQCLFAERQPLSDIMNEFGELTSTYYWASDSGFISTRTYQDSATVTGSIDYTLTTSDIIEGTFVIKDNPIGLIYYQSDKASLINFEHRFDFITGQYTEYEVRDRTNDSYCSSAYASGIRKEKKVSTKYVYDNPTSTVTKIADNLVRKYARESVIVEGSLPARFVGLEIADILQINHESLFTTPSLFQVTRVEPDYDRGNVFFTANEIVND